MRLIFLGAPGSGKGTQAKILQDARGLAQLSTGDLLRAAVKEGSELGREASTFMNAGVLVPDKVMIALILKRMAQLDGGGGYILDGFPRTQAQAQALEEALDELGQPIDAVIELKIDQAKVLERLLGRRICPNGHGEWHVVFNPPTREGRCDFCGEPLVHRDDDHEEQILTRLDEFHQLTEPLSKYYAERGILRQVDASTGMEEIAKAIEAIVTDGAA